jgi:hypothetical protein
MTVSNTLLAAEIPVPEAEKLLFDAIRMGVSIQEFVGYHLLRSAFGVFHPTVAEFEASHRGTALDEKKVGD